jgi:hypothetical protein
MSSNSEIILSNQVHPGDSTTETVTGDKYKGDGYYGRSDGLHTVQVNLNGFIGQVEIQGTLAVDPTDEDWFTVSLGGTVTSTVDTTGLISSASTAVTINYSQNETSVKTYNFTGNYVWLRAKVSNWTDGTINSIALNH